MMVCPYREVIFIVYSNPEKAGSRPRLLVERLVLLLLVFLAVRTWCIEGLATPLRVAGGSMARTLLGMHREVVCADCGHEFVCGSDVRPVGARAVCPNCGYAENDLEALLDLAGDRLLVHKSIFRFRRPRRWEVVASRHPQDAAETVVKRVVGLPGESVQLRLGDVYVDGQIERKTLWQQRALAVLVHDARRGPALGQPPPCRWRALRAGSQWGRAGSRFAHPVASPEDPIDWLAYHHWRRLPGGGGQIEERPISDDRGYNQTRPRRKEDSHRVTDLLLTLRLVEIAGRGAMYIRATGGREKFLLEIESEDDPNRFRYKVSHNGQPVPGGTGKMPSPAGGLTLEVSLIDKQFLLAFDGRTVLRWAYRPPDKLPPPICRPLEIGTRGLRVVFEDPKVYRDIYYAKRTGPQGRDPDRPVRLGADEYFVLGDNSPISEDSRTWGPVSARLLIGKPLLVHFPARRVSFGAWDFQVPDPGKIRYIR